MTFVQFIYSIVIILLITFCVLLSFFIIHKTIRRSRNKLDELTFEELFEIVNTIISNEISLYERNIFNNGGRIIEKATYDNYYRDILQNIFESISDDLVRNITQYLNKESFYSMVSREVQVYLNSKIS